MNIAQPLKPKGSLSLIPKLHAVQTGAHIVNDVDDRNILVTCGTKFACLQKHVVKFLSYIKYLKNVNIGENTKTTYGKRKAQRRRNAIFPTPWASMNTGCMVITMHAFLRADRCCFERGLDQDQYI